MTSVEQRLQMKREPLDKWSIREQLCLASAVTRSGDQNWMSVSRALKQFGEPNRPSDWFHQKNCAAQYGALLSNVETPKRKKRNSAGDYSIETPSEAILRQLKAERIAELKKLLHEEKTEYLKLQSEMSRLNSITEEELDKMCKEIDEEENRKENEAIKHAQWLKERESRKLEIERAWRPLKLAAPLTLNVPKRKSSDSNENSSNSMEINSGENNDNIENINSNSTTAIESPKTSLALSPLLTSLLKSPSQVQNVNQQQQSSILHSAITQRVPASNSSNPMITSLLNSNNNNNSVSASTIEIQQLVSSAINASQTQLNSAENNVNAENQNENGNNPITTPHPELLDDETLRNLKIEDIANSIVQDGPLPEIKNDVDVIISDLIADPEQHLMIDNNGDININLELEDLDEEELETEEDPTEKGAKMSGNDTETTNNSEKIEEKTEPGTEAGATETVEDAVKEVKDVKELKEVKEAIDPFEFQEDPDVFEPKLQLKSNISQPERTPENNEDDEKSPSVVPAKSPQTGSVEIVEVAEEEDENSTNAHATNNTSIPPISTINPHPLNPNENVDEVVKVELELDEDTETKAKADLEIKTETEKFDYEEMEVKMDKEKAKRDYSRTKKKEEKDIDILLAIEKSQCLDDLEELDEEVKLKDEIKSETERSNSPWTTNEEEESKTNTQNQERKLRRFSTPVSDSVSIPNSPASSSFLTEDDKDYRNWKKSIMLVYSWLAAHKYSSLFLKPITEDHAPGYHSLIYRPMDFQTIRKNIENGSIRSTIEFKRDVMLMLNNAIMYNKTNGTVYNMTREIQQEAMESIRLLLQAQTSGDTPPRRETRTSEPGTKRKRGFEENSRSKKRRDD